MTALEAGSLATEPEEEDTHRWLELLEQLDVEDLLRIFTTLLQDIPDYNPPRIPLADLQRTARTSFAALIADLRDGEELSTAEIASELGLSRARAGVPIASLMAAIRLDFTVLWGAITSVARPEDAKLIVRRTPAILATVDGYAVQTQRAYVAELQRMQSEATSVLQGHIARLFQGPPPTGERIEAIAAGLGVPVDATFKVAAAVGDDVGPLHLLVSDANRAGLTVFTYHFEDTLVAFYRPSQLALSRREEIEDRFRSLRIGLLSANGGLAEVRDAANTAHALAKLIGDEETEALTWRTGWARVARTQLLAANHPVIADVQAGLARCGNAERLRLREAVDSYLQTGSIGESAAALFCHRNTLANRLRRFSELTGVDPLIPQQAARLVIGWA